MGAALRYLEGALLAGLGAYMVVLSRSSVYWQLLNPRYAWLTLAAGLLIAALGTAHLCNRARSGRWSEAAALALLGALAVVAYLGPEMLTSSPSTGVGAGSLTRTFDDLPEEKPTETLDGQTYIRINLAELLAAEEGGLARPGERFAVQGAVLRTPDLDRDGYIAVGRLYVFCCFADAVGVVALVKVDDPAAYPVGTWVRVLGELREADVLPGMTPQVPGSLSAGRSDRLVIEARMVEETTAEGVPFIMDVRQAQPFAY